MAEGTGTAALDPAAHAIAEDRAPGAYGSVMLGLPALLFVAVFFVIPGASLFSESVLTQTANGNIGLPVSLAQYHHLLATPVYRAVLLTTLRISAITAVLAMLAGFPVAIVIVRAGAAVSRIATIVLVAPLMVSVVVRNYGWQLLLGNSTTGVLNWLLHALGTGPAPLHVMYSQTAVIIGSLHVFLPMMVLPLASAIARIPLALEEAARTLGASAWRVFWRVTVPMSLPGLIAGLMIVFSLTCSSFVTPAILGGSHGAMLGNLLEEQALTVFNWPLSAAIGVVMVLLSVAVGGGVTRALQRRSFRVAA